MINTISQLSKVASKADSSQNIRFNSSLPITISVLKSLPMDRYKLLLGNREFTTKSHKKLEEKAQYWGNFGESKDGIITISGLVKKPSFLQGDDSFFDIDVSAFLSEYKETQYPNRNFKNWILANLALKDIEKYDFKSLTNMLLALNDSVIHLPFKSYNKPILVQFQSSFTDELEFYLAYENLGPIRGKLLKSQNSSILYLDILFEKTFLFLKKELKSKGGEFYMNINKDIQPLYSSDKMILDIKG